MRRFSSRLPVAVRPAGSFAALALVALFALLTPSHARATSFLPVTFDALVAQADVIFVGEVADVHPFTMETPEGTIIKTRVTFRVDEPLAGGPGIVQVFDFLGGEANGVGMKIAVRHFICALIAGREYHQPQGSWSDLGTTAGVWVGIRRRNEQPPCPWIQCHRPCTDQRFDRRQGNIVVRRLLLINRDRPVTSVRTEYPPPNGIECDRIVAKTDRELSNEPPAARIHNHHDAICAPHERAVPASV